MIFGDNRYQEHFTVSCTGSYVLIYKLNLATHNKNAKYIVDKQWQKYNLTIQAVLKGKKKLKVVDAKKSKLIGICFGILILLTRDQ